MMIRESGLLFGPPCTLCYDVQTAVLSL